MVILIVERVSPSLRGEMTRWMLEPRPGVFVGNPSALVRDRLWEKVCRNKKTGAAILVRSTDSEQGFAFAFSGETTRAIVDFDGLSLIQIP